MTKVFVGGSRHVSHLNGEVQKRLDNIVSEGFRVIIGDAPGADKAVQSYLHGIQYENVEVFCSEGICRNNLGIWPTHAIATATRERTVEFYSAKDRVMAREADYGLMLWDGESIGTLMNLYRLVALEKKAVVYTVPDGAFTDLRHAEDWQAFMERQDTAIRSKLKRRASLEVDGKANAAVQHSLFEVS